MLRELSGSNRLTFLTNMRSDQILFDFYTGLAERPLAEVLLEARARLAMYFKIPCASRVAETTVVVIRVRRRFINRQKNRHEIPPGAVFLRAPRPGSSAPLQKACGCGQVFVSWVAAGL